MVDSLLARQEAAGYIRQPLTPRENAVLRLVTHAYSNREVAAKLRIREETVTRHLASIYHKLQVTDRGLAAVYAMRTGMVKDRYIPDSGIVEIDGIKVWVS